jgi:MurNAc alpha-1-phosphate uridylyltransferase
MTPPAMVFAAGLGTRMRPLTDDRPKALVRVAGRPLIDHALDQVAGCAPVAVNAHHHAAPLLAHLAGRDLHLIHETPMLLDTGGGLRNALPLLGPGPVLTMNADACWTGPRAADTLRAAWRDGMEGLLLLVPAARALGQAGGAFAMAPNGRLRRDPAGLVYTGAGIVRTEGLLDDPREAFSLRDLWFGMIDRGTLHGVIHPGRWADVGTPDGVAAAEAMLEAVA